MKKILKPKLLIMIGIAGSGKTTYCRRYLKLDNYSCVSADSVRHLLYDYNKLFEQERENEVWEMVWKDFMTAIKKTQNIYLDNTNLTRSVRMPFVYVARSFGYRIEMVLFKTSIIKILQQNKLRERKVPENVICRQMLALQHPEPSEYDSIEITSYDNEAKW